MHYELTNNIRRDLVFQGRELSISWYALCSGAINSKMCGIFAIVVAFFACADFCMSQLPPNVSSTVSLDKGSYQNKTDLYENILTGYDKRVKPRKDQSESVKVTFLFRILGITEFDTASQKLSILGIFLFSMER